MNYFCFVVYKFGNEVLNGNCSVGQLTKIGFEQQMNNGKTLRDAYVGSGFLSQNLSSSEVYIRSDGKFVSQKLPLQHINNIIVTCFF